MSKTLQRFALVLLAVSLLGTALLAMQGRRSRRGWRGEGGGGRYGQPDPNNRGGVPVWEFDERFKKDAFTFARVQFEGGRWWTDYPDSDHNFSLRLHQLTSLHVNPYPAWVRLDSEELYDYPFIYMIEVGGIYLSEAEINGLRRYCLNGGFVMIDDFWGDWARYTLDVQLKRAFPNRPAQPVPLEHEIFQCVYPLTEKPQIPAYNEWGSWRVQTYESNHDGDTSTPHYDAIYDDDGRIMVFICHNTDLGDGWEREGIDPDYFKEYSVKKSYPLGINIVTYAMTH